MAKKKDPRVVVEKKFPDFLEEVAGLSVKDLEAKMLTLAKYRHTVQEDMEANPGYIKLEQEADAAKENLDQLKKPTKDAIEAIDIKSKFLIILIREKGGQV